MHWLFFLIPPQEKSLSFQLAYKDFNPILPINFILINFCHFYFWYTEKLHIIIGKARKIFFFFVFLFLELCYMIWLYVCGKKWNQEWNIDWNKRVKKNHFFFSWHPLLSSHIDLKICKLLYHFALLVHSWAIKLNDSMKILLCFDIIDLMHD